jgi:hypothetical protein
MAPVSSFAADPNATWERTPNDTVPASEFNFEKKN